MRWGLENRLAQIIRPETGRTVMGIGQAPEEKVEIRRAELALARALNRLRVARRAG